MREAAGRGGGGGGGRGEADYVPLFETRKAKGRGLYKVFASTVFLGICLIWVYRLTHMPRVGEGGRCAWIGMFAAELWFGFYWILTQSLRWNVIYRYPFKDRLSLRYEDKLPGVDIFICTADPELEPPTLVINTVLSVMAYNYPTQKLSVYLSDDGGSEFTFYALLEASRFSRYWLPFCKRYNVEPRSPAAYFALSNAADHLKDDIGFSQQYSYVKKLYTEMESRIDRAMGKGSISKEIRGQHKGFSEWNSNITKQDHQSIVQILIDGRHPDEVDVDGHQLPTLVYLAREKRPNYPHNFKAGSVNALIRVSSEISNGPIILNLDCDMYSNDSDAIRDALCFLMDEEQSHEVSYVQHPQRYENITKNNLYSNLTNPVNQIELPGIDGHGATLYCGTGCFHRRASLCGMVCSKDHRANYWNNATGGNFKDKSIDELERASKIVADCSYESGTQWGTEIGLIYGCAVEDIVTGLRMQCRGWKPVYYYPDRSSFLGVAPTTLDQALIQYKRWSEGMFQIFLSKYCPLIYGNGKIKLGAQMGYCVYLLWATMSLPTLYYVIVPPLCFLQGISLFPQVSSMWLVPFMYVFIARNACSLSESLSCGDTLKAWWNMQRMWIIRRTTSFLFAFVDTIIKQLGLSQTTFAITAKVMDADAQKRYEQEMMEFGSSSIMFTIISTLALVNLFSLAGGIFKRNVGQFLPQIILCGLVVMLNLPVYQALFLRSDNGHIPSSVMFKSIVIVSVTSILATLF